MVLRRLGFLTLLGAVLLGCHTRPLAPPPHFQAWRDRRLMDIGGPDGWASLAGLFWLKEGEAIVGTRGDALVRLPMGSAPDVVGKLIRQGDNVRFVSAPGVRVMLRGYSVTERDLVTDVDDQPDILEVGRVKFWILHRGDRRGVRVRDPEAPERKEFSGIPVYSYNTKFRVIARWEPYDPPRKIAVSDITGGRTEEVCPGRLVFTIDDKECRLETVEDSAAGDLFLMFRDETSGKETYGGGRFLHVTKPTATGEVLVDFNLAYNPPCAFTPHATCPVPPRQNALPVEIKAGERYRNPKGH